MPKATFNGKTYEFPEGTSQDKMVELINSQNSESSHNPIQNHQKPAQSQPEESSWGLYNSEDGSIWNTTKAGLNRQYQNAIAALDSDQVSSDYQNVKAKRASEVYRQESSKLGVAGNIVSGVASYAPIIATSMVNPVVGASLMGAATTTDALAAQAENGKDYDWDSAGLAGIGSSALDLATMGVASRGSNIARTLSSPVKRVAADLGSQAGQASVSNAGAQAFTNLASGRPWEENIGEAALIGGVTGGAMHGGLSGFNKLLNLNPTKDSTSSIQDVRDISNSAGITPHETFTSGVHEYHTTTSNIRQDMENSNIADSAQHVDALVNVGLTSPESNMAALKDAAKAAKDSGLPVTSNFFNFDINGQNAATSLLGISHSQITRDGQNIQHAAPGLFDRAKAQKSGETRESWKDDFQKKYRESFNGFLGNLNTNLVHLNTLIDSNPNMPSSYNRSLRDLRDSISNYNKMASTLYQQGVVPTNSNLGHYASNIYKLGNETGVLKDLVNPLTGKAGSFDPVLNMKSMDMFRQGAIANYPNLQNGIPNMQAEKGGYQVNAVDIAGAALGTPLLTVGRALGKAYTAGRSQSHLRGSKDRGAQLVDGLAREPASFRNNAAESGDFRGGAQEAAADLESMGISTGGARQTVESDVSGGNPSEPRTPSVEETVWGRDTSTPEIVPEPTPVRESVNPDPWTGRSIREHEARLEEQRLAEQAAQEAEPGAPTRSVTDSELAQSARVDSSRRASPMEEPVSPQPRDRTFSEDASRTPAKPRTTAGDIDEAFKTLSQGFSDSSIAHAAEKGGVKLTRPESVQALRDGGDKFLYTIHDDGTATFYGGTNSKGEVVGKVPESQSTPEQPVESISTKDAPEEISRPNKPRVKSSELARKPIDELVNKVNDMSVAGRNKNPQLVIDAYTQMEKLKRVERAVRKASDDGRLSSEDVWDSINRQGGLDRFSNDSDVGSTLNAMLRKDRDDIAAQAKADSEAATKIVDSSINKEVGESVEQVIQRMRNDFISKDIPEDVFDAAVKSASDLFNGNHSPTHVGNQVKVIMKRRSDEAREAAKNAKEKAVKTPKGSETSKPKPIERTLEDSHSDLSGYAYTLGVLDEPEIKKLIAEATQSGNKSRTKMKPISQGREQSIYNKIDNFIEDQIKSYEKALSAPKVDNHPELANWKKKKAKLEDGRSKIKNSNDWQSTKAEERLKVANAKIKESESKDAAVKKAEDEAKAAEDASKSVEGAIKEFDDSVTASVDKAAKLVQDELKDVSDVRIKNAATEATGSIPGYVTSKFDPDYLKFKASMQGASDALRSRGLSREAYAVQRVVSAMENALERKAIFPNDESLWLSHEDVKFIKDGLNGGVKGNSWYGDLYQRLRVSVYGDDGIRSLSSSKKIDEKINRSKYDPDGDVGGLNAPGIK